jgi:hypothetical protein
VFLDCGDDLITSPRVPWCGEYNQMPYMLTASINDLSVLTSPDTDYNLDDVREQDFPGNTPLRQSLSQIHLNYGNSLNGNARSRDPFYLLTDLFQQDVSNESLTLDLIADKVDQYTIGVEASKSGAIDY